MEKDRLSEPTVNEDIFVLGKAGRIEPADLDPTQESYTWRHKLPAEQQTYDEFAEDTPVKILRSTPHGTFFLVPVKCLARVNAEIIEGRPIDCSVSADGIILADNEEFADIEQGYFLSGDPLPGHETEETIAFAKVPAQLGRVGFEAAA